jgi:hypothetical protein
MVVRHQPSTPEGELTWPTRQASVATWLELFACPSPYADAAHMFVENLVTTFPVRDSRLTWPAGDKPTEWVAGEDIAAVGASVLADGPGLDAGKTYWMSTDVFNGAQLADILSQALEQPITADVITPSDLLKDTFEGTEAAPSFMEANYALSAFEWLQQTSDGRMDYSAVTTTDVEQDQNSGSGSTAGITSDRSPSERKPGSPVLMIQGAKGLRAINGAIGAATGGLSISCSTGSAWARRRH